MSLLSPKHSLENKAIRWLALGQRCHAVLLERNPVNVYGSRPDVLGIQKNRHRIEVEVKRSIQDFKANALKSHVVHRNDWLKSWPRKFYFLVTEPIRDKALELLPDYAGLLCEDYWSVIVVKPAPVNSESRRLTTRQCISAFHLLSNQLLSISGAIYEKDREPEYEI